MTGADEQMPASDRILMKALGEALGGVQPPADLAARCEGLLGWLDVDAELAEFLDQSALDSTGTRGPAGSTPTLEFTVADGSCVIELNPLKNVMRGQLLGGEAQHVVVRTAAGDTHALPVDELGHFSLDQPISGSIRLELELFPDGRRIHTDWFVV